MQAEDSDEKQKDSELDFSDDNEEDTLPGEFADCRAFQKYSRLFKKTLGQYLYHIKSGITLCTKHPNLGFCYPIA